jgi:hypothetical protein
MYVSRFPWMPQTAAPSTNPQEETNGSVTHGTDQRPNERTVNPEAPSKMSPVEFVTALGDVKSLLTFQEMALAYFGERSPEGPSAVREWESRYPDRCEA